MTDPLKAHTLLVIPSDDLLSMLDGGPCGFRPPIASRYRCSDTRRWRWLPDRHVDAPLLARVDEDSGGGLSGPYALVLRWQGQGLPHGWLAAGLALGRSVAWYAGGSEKRRIGQLIESGCTLIALDEQGKEVTDD